MVKISWVIIILIVVGSFAIINSYDFDLGEKSDQVSFVKVFARWMFQVGKSVKNTVGYAFNQEWMPKNETESDNNTEPVEMLNTYIVQEDIVDNDEER